MSRYTGFCYILGYHKRGRDVSDHLLDRYQNLDQFAAIPGEDEDGLLYLEINERLEDDPPGTRYLLCHNPEKAVDDHLFREHALSEAEQELKKLAERLSVQALQRPGHGPQAVDLPLSRFLPLKQQLPALFLPIQVCLLDLPPVVVLPRLAPVQGMLGLTGPLLHGDKEKGLQVSPDRIQEALNTMQLASVTLGGEEVYIKAKNHPLGNQIFKKLSLKLPKNISTKEELEGCFQIKKKRESWGQLCLFSN
jgi:hypothetical protein